MADDNPDMVEVPRAVLEEALASKPAPPPKAKFKWSLIVLIALVGYAVNKGRLYIKYGDNQTTANRHYFAAHHFGQTAGWFDEDLRVDCSLTSDSAASWQAAAEGTEFDSIGCK